MGGGTPDTIQLRSAAMKVCEIEDSYFEVGAIGDCNTLSADPQY